MQQAKTIIALDVGNSRIGVAIARGDVAIARPLTTLERSDATMVDIQKLIEHHSVDMIVAGLPRGLDGQTTAQTEATQQFVAALQPHIAIPLVWQDEALTSVKAKDELAARGKAYQKGDVDALAATYILDDYLLEAVR